MYCQQCGAYGDDDAAYCMDCGARLGAPVARPPPADPFDDPPMRMILPVGRSFLAIAAGYAGLFPLLVLVLAIAGVGAELFSVLVVVPAPLALLLGILAIRDLRQRPDKLGMDRAVFGVVMGALGSIVLVVMLGGMLVSGARGN